MAYCVLEREMYILYIFIYNICKERERESERVREREKERDLKGE